MAARTFDVAVIGGGLVGARSPAACARSGARLVVLDEGDVAYRASRGNFGLVWVQGKGAGLPQYGELDAALGPALAGARRAARRGNGRRRRAGAAAAASTVPHRGASSTLRVAAIERLARAAGLRALRGRGPRPRRARAAAAGRSGRTSSAERTARSTATAIRCVCCARCTRRCTRRRRYRPNQGVERIAPRGGGFDMRMPRRHGHAGKVVLAAGLGNAALAPMVGLAAPVRPQKGQIIVLERVRPFLDRRSRRSGRPTKAPC